jgi:hypothetical protein
MTYRLRHRCIFDSCVNRLMLRVLALVFLGPLGIATPQDGPLYVYPAQGQDHAQQDKNRYECHNWAVSQTGFDPTKPQATAPDAGSSADYRPSQPHVARGAARGATLGAIGGAITGDTGKGAAAGAAMGGAAGAFRRRDERRQQVAARPAGNSTTANGRPAYDRALAACLKGRGYSVL